MNSNKWCKDIILHLSCIPFVELKKSAYREFWNQSWASAREEMSLVWNLSKPVSSILCDLPKRRLTLTNGIWSRRSISYSHSKSTWLCAISADTSLKLDSHSPPSSLSTGPFNSVLWTAYSIETTAHYQFCSFPKTILPSSLILYPGCLCVPQNTTKMMVCHFLNWVIYKRHCSFHLDPSLPLSDHLF